MHLVFSSWWVSTLVGHWRFALLLRLRKAASAAQAQVRQLKARAELKSREAEDSFALAQAAEEKAQALEAAGLAQAGPFSPLPYSPVQYSPLPIQNPAISKGWMPSSIEAAQGSLQRNRGTDSGAMLSNPHAAHVLKRPVTPLPESEEEQAQLLQATW